MRLARNWKEIATKAWSFWLMALVVVLSGAEMALPVFFTEADFPPGVFSALAGLLGSLAMFARVLAQSNMEGRE